MHQLVLFAHGYDIPGVGSALTKILFDNNCNIENFKMTTMDGYFSLIVLFHPHDPLNRNQLEAELLDSVASFKVDVQIFDAAPPKKALKQIDEEWIPYRITITCDNRAGLIYFFMREMARMEINVIDVRCIPMEPDEERSSHILCKIEVPITVNMEQVRQRLKVLAKDLIVEIDIEPIGDLEFD